MKETLDAAFSAINIIPTVFLILILIYWLTVIIGVFNIDSFDIDADADLDVDVDVDADVDLDADIDADADVSAGDSLLWLNSALSFFNLGKVPFMLILSFFVLSMWVISLLMNNALNNGSVLLSLVYLIPNILVSAFIMKFLTSPFVKLFEKAESDIDSNVRLTGKMCKVTLNATHHKMGQAEIKIEGSSFIINVKSTEEQYNLYKGDSCLVIDYIPEKKIYLIEPYKN
ncbi:OB-fold-containig protein [Labilibacter marinus]|uniref:OB-fold-containig protein n=1 Tax=Labilibacter marinus TaxID=1477105 RepID=UPI00094F7716|nr:OB-fold-containig protein [Labilibacter marinus]